MSRRLRAGVAVAVLGAFLAGVVAAGLIGSTPSPGERPADLPRPPADAGDVDGGSGDSATAGAATGFTRSEEGAREAAIAYATASQRWLHLSDDELEAAVRALSSEDAAERLVQEVVAEVSLARDALVRSAGPVWWLVRPLAWRLENYSPERARVAVWTVSVLSAADVAVPQADWLTVTVELVWEAGDWRVDDVRDTPGPTPMVGVRDQPWQPEPFDDALAGFERLGDEVG